MPVPHIPDQPDSSGGNKRHSQPISVSFPILPPAPHHYHDTTPLSSSALAGLADPSVTSSSAPAGAGARPGPRGPHAVLPPTEPGFRIPVGAEPDTPVEEAAAYDGPPPDYVENTMSLPSEKIEEKKRLGKK
ncbi:hypothetical protein BGZ92_000063 [Podila epicladia]|nr:hypothetical protein BGZ92_000063 [Podila epicladia]